MKKKALFILSGNLSTTPRAVKAIELAAESFAVDVVFLSRGERWSSMDAAIACSLPVNKLKAISISRTANWLLLSVVQQVLKMYSAIFNGSSYVKAFSTDKSGIFLLSYLAKKDLKVYDLLVGHSYGAILPTTLLASKNGLQFSLDLEDYHPGEKTYTDKPTEEVKVKEEVLKLALRKASSLSFASPLIYEHFMKLAGVQVKDKSAIVNNTFKQDEFVSPVISGAAKLKFVWFSQTISYGRGLELVLPAMEAYKHLITLTLIGNLSEDFDREVLQRYKGFTVTKPPMEQRDLHCMLSEFDIGLALEMSAKDLNRTLALTNKLFAYCQSGLFMLATDTAAQKEFLSRYPKAGICTAQTPEGIRNAIDEIVKKKEQLLQGKVQRYQIAKELNWESEKFKLAQLWTKTLK